VDVLKAISSKWGKKSCEWGLAALNGAREGLWVARHVVEETSLPLAVLICVFSEFYLNRLTIEISTLAINQCATQPVNSAEECAQMALAFETAYPAGDFLPLKVIDATRVSAT